MEPTDPKAVAARGEFDRLELGDLVLRRGGTLEGAMLAYKTHGRLNEAADNAILAPSAFGGTHLDWEWLIGPGRPLDTDRFFVVCTNLFGTGVSTSPSNWNGEGPFPAVSIADNVGAQRRLVREELGIERLRAVVGWSMGAMQTFHWAAAHPEEVPAAFAFCGSATVGDHCRVFLDGIRRAIELDPAWEGGRYASNPEAAMRVAGRIWAAWGHSSGFYAERRYEELGMPDLESYLSGWWEAYFLARDANDVLALISTWESADLAEAVGPEGSAEEALGRITARTIVAPAATDMYFPPVDQEREAAAIADAEVRILPGVYGHLACIGAFAQPAAVIESAIADLLVDA